MDVKSLIIEFGIVFGLLYAKNLVLKENKDLMALGKEAAIIFVIMLIAKTLKARIPL